ncbi:HlyD family secretion protein [Hymenobacter weizhouensis]|uniref:HlyD family secretion protein n=1 Tax=Hymenobacter sp. YIM 151500-1 TaxID=2987689 RepID=UPI0022271E99|nr:efflux RND transporter periplasmic adaptor subunit [Hymenobacter sp. YIM 151500-1]UYZ61778.1 efflux RND transporter periplasmic adaptor subunit [Hymenobacter sp. YIM 151500-1]
MRKYSFWWGLLLLVGCGGNDEQKPAAAPAPVAVQPAQVREVVALGRIEPEAKLSSLAAEVSGVVSRLAVREGQRVQKGDLLLELTSTVEQAQLTQARSRLATQQAQIQADEAALRSAQAKAANLRRTADRVADLAAQGADTQQSADDARTDYQVQEQEVARLQSTLAAARRQLQELRADIGVNAAQLAQRQVRAPTDGQVLRLDVEVGSSVSPGTSLGDFAPAGRTTALCEVDELFAGRVREGQAAYIRPQGGQDTLATGTVIYVAPYLKQKSLFAETAGDAEDRRVREVRIVLPQAQNLLFNSRVECVIFL